MNTVDAISLFPAYDPTRSYGSVAFSGKSERHYQSDMIDAAIRADRVPAIQETISRGWLAPECRSFTEQTVISYAEMRGAKQVAEYLRSLDWPE